MDKIQWWALYHKIRVARSLCGERRTSESATRRQLEAANCTPAEIRAIRAMQKHGISPQYDALAYPE